MWQNSKINYVFVFEYDTRHHLDWRQLCEVRTILGFLNMLLTESQLPCLFFFFLGLTMWINFSQFGSNTMYIYYPVILIGLTALVIFFPAPILYHRSRVWLLYSNVSKRRQLKYSTDSVDSGDCFSLDYIQWSFATSIWEICSALWRTAWGWVCLELLKSLSWSGV